MAAKLIAVLVMLAALFAGGWNVGADRVQHKWDKERLEMAEELRVVAEENQRSINKLESTKDENLETISGLRDDIAGLRVRVPKAPCAGTESSARGGDGVAAGGQSVDTPQAAFDRFRRSLESDAADDGKIIENCRVVVDWAKGLK